MSQASVSYSGVAYPRKATYTTGHGILPGIIRVEFLPQDPALIDLNATFSMQCNGSITLLNVRTDKATISRMSGKNTMELYAKDERWKWQFSNFVDKIANRPQPSGYEGSRERVSARDLCIELAAYLNIPYNFNLVPDDQYPPVKWRSANAAVELEKLLALYGLVPVFDPFGRVLYASIPGTGTAPVVATTHVVSQAIGVDQADGPADIRVVGQDIRYQTFVKTEAVGYDPSDKKIKPIDDLSYAVDWTKQDPLNLHDNSWSDSELFWARKSVFKMYRVKEFTTGTLSLHGWDGDSLEPMPTSINDILPLDKNLITTGLDSDDRERQLNPFLVGRFAVLDETVESARITETDVRNTHPSTIVEAPFKINFAEGITYFESPIYKIEDDEPAPADLWLACSFRFRHPTSGLKQYYYFEEATGITGGVGKVTVDAPELTRILIDNYTDGDPESYSTTTDNATTINTAAEAIIDLKTLEYQDVSSYAIQYRHIWEITPNGAIKQLRYDINLEREGSNPPPAYTVAYINSEVDESLMTSIQRFRIRSAMDAATMNAEWRRKIFIGEGRDDAEL